MGLTYLIKSCSKSVTQKKTLPSHRPIFHDTGLIGEQILKSDGQNPYKPIILPHFFENAPSKNHPGHRPSPVAPAAAVVVALRVLARAVRAPEVKIGRITWKSEKLWGNHKSSCTKLCFSHLCKRPSKHSGCCTVYIYICMGVSINEGFQNGWFIMENPKIKWMIWGYPHFRKPPYIYIRIYILD